MRLIANIAELAGGTVPEHLASLEVSFTEGDASDAASDLGVVMMDAIVRAIREAEEVGDDFPDTFTVDITIERKQKFLITETRAITVPASDAQEAEEIYLDKGEEAAMTIDVTARDITEI